MIISVFDNQSKKHGKKEKLLVQFLFPQCFKKASLPGPSKGVIVWEWIKDLTVN